MNAKDAESAVGNIKSIGFTDRRSDNLLRMGIIKVTQAVLDMNSEKTRKG